MALKRKQVLLTAVVTVLIGAGLIVSPEAVLGRIGAILDSPLFPLVLVGLYLVRPFLAWPITGIAVLVGYKYGLVAGVPIALAGAAVSTLIPYAAVRYFDLDSGILGKAAEDSEEFFSETGDLRGLIAARVAPFPAEATSLAAGAAHLSPSTFVVGTLIGETPWAVAAVTIGHSMHRLSLSGVSFNPWLLAATAVAALVLVAGPLYRFAKRFRGDETDEAPDRRGADPER
jgi:uncharacterized membrane protein YdjX (TVP38/TMEM64 family)